MNNVGWTKGKRKSEIRREYRRERRRVEEGE